MTPPEARAQGGRRSMPPLSIGGRLRYDVVRRILGDLRPETVLEIGCGQGAFGARLATVTSYAGVEPDDESFALALERIAPRGGEVMHGLHTIVPAGSTYDVVCAFEVLEHLEDDAAALAEWVRLVRPGGHLVLSVPAFQKRFGPWDTFAGHFRRYDPQALRELLLAAGLVDIGVTVYGWPITYPLEWVRNRVARRTLDRAGAVSLEELTAGSGRRFQPASRATGAVIAAAVAPFRLLQRGQPTKGTGLVAVGRRV